MRQQRNQQQEWFVRLSGLLLMLLMLVFPQPMRAQATSPDLVTYRAWIRETLAAARRGDQIALEDTGLRLSAVTEVLLPDQTRVRVDNRWLRSALVQPTPDTELIIARLGALADALAQPVGAAHPDALERLRAILANPPYNDPAPPEMPGWLTDFLSWLGRLLERLILWNGTPAAASPWFSWPLLLIGVLLLVGVLLYLLRGLRRGIIQPATRPDDDPEANLTARQALDQATQLAQSGDYRTAVRMLYLAALLRLDERGQLRYDRSLTNREYLERLRENPALQNALMPIVETFDRVWYGHTRLDSADFDSYRMRVERLGRD